MINGITYACVIPSTGRASLLSRTIPSVLQQKRKFEKIIVVYDLAEGKCSFSHESQVKVFYTGGNKGGPYAQNIGFKEANATFVVLLDDDDSLHENFLQSIDLFLTDKALLPDLILPKVRKIWLDNFIPSQTVVPPSKIIDVGNQLCNSIFSEWTPYTCSGFVVKRVGVNELPLITELRGFNDLQIYRNIRQKKNSRIWFSKNSIVNFYQYFSSDRKTSSYLSRKSTLDKARQIGVVFSDSEQNRILVGAFFSEARKIAHVNGLKASYNFIFKQNKSEFMCLWRYSSTRRVFVNFAFILWISFFRVFSGPSDK